MIKLEEICPYKVRVYYPPNILPSQGIVSRRNPRAINHALNRILEIYPDATWEVIQWPAGEQKIICGGGQ